MPESEIEVAGRGKVLLEQVFHRFQDGDDLNLHIQGAPPPDEPSGHGPAEGRVKPFLLRTHLHRHHVDVGGEKDRLQALIPPLPAVEVTVAANNFPLQRGMDSRIGALQVRDKLRKGGPVSLGGVSAGNGLQLHRPGQPLRSPVDVNFHARDRLHRVSPGPESQSAA